MADEAQRATLERRPPLTLANKAARAIWDLVRLVLYRPSPTPLHAWRRMILRGFGAKIGRGARPYPAARIWAPWNLEMGDFSVMGNGVECYCVGHIHLGAHATVSQRAHLCAAGRDIDAPEHHLLTGPIVIADHAWVAAEAYIGPGVTVGAGGVVAARAVVVRDVAPWTVVGGNPAKFLRNRARLPR
ncbi:putative colanic acid biosynthesis acetyltransferase [Sphingomonas sp. 28-63-12]|uniref:putative colanic acid biosynthesis acetyltransferase n=1 Tax=Sphingomonas sp. 28-63-12 TaxID=1970434 RepID=UPI0035A90E30